MARGLHYPKENNPTIRLTLANTGEERKNNDYTPRKATAVFIEWKLKFFACKKLASYPYGHLLEGSNKKNTTYNVFLNFTRI